MAISFKTAARPPRVASLSMAIFGSTASISAISLLSGAQSDFTLSGNSKPCRPAKIAAEWSPIVPEIKIFMPARTFFAEISTPLINSPMPAVLIKIPSACPRPTTLVSPVTIKISASRAVFAIESTIFFKFSRSKPSSIIIPTEIYLGIAPVTAKSLTVPQIESLPMSPPRKKIGRTT